MATIQQPLVLIVDDDESVLEALSALLVPRLEPLFRVETALSGEMALEILEADTDTTISNPIALVISDERMPGMTGNDLLIALREHCQNQHGGSIMITAYAGLPSAQRAINEAEVDKYFPKPWDTDKALLPAVAMILERFVQRSGLASYQISEVVGPGANLDDVKAVRREWWIYMTYMGDMPDAEDLPENLPSFDMSGDEEATHIILHRCERHDDRPVACVRLRPTGKETDWKLDGLAFRPREANKDTETLLLRTAMLSARSQGAKAVHVKVPMLRQDVYRDLGFMAASEANIAAETPAAGPMDMICDLAAAEAIIGGVPSGSFERRFAVSQSLCRCAQVGCPGRDYAAEQRGYYCPLDVQERRIPEGFPGEAVS